ncbi:MAG: Ig-like domain-containing protein [Candidatus Thiodiazotropha sp. L084R]
MSLKKNIKPLFLSLLISLTLIACGGGSGGGDESAQTSPDDSSQDDPVDDGSTNPDETPNPDQGDTSPNPDDDSTPPADEDTPPQATNQPPVANISGNQSVTSGETLTLDGSSSNDPDGDSLSFIWSQTQGPSITLIGNNNPSLSLIAPDVTQTTTLGIQLSVSDGEYSSISAIEIQVSPMTDTTAPAITSRSPLADAIGVSTTTNISISFDESLDESQIDNQSLQVTQAGTPVSGTVSYDNSSETLTLTFDAALQADTSYTVTTGANLQDPSGNQVENSSWSFTTGSSYNLGATTQATIDQCMDEGDKLMLTLVNNARGVARYCGGTNYKAVEAIAWNCLLDTAALNHSTSMADNDYFSHTGLDDSSPGDRITAAGYTWRTYAENIAAGYADEEAAMTAWLESPGHCVNIMSSRVTELGAGVSENPTSQYRIYWTQDFADQ